MPRIMIFQEKHDIRCFAADTDEQAGVVALKLLSERDREEWFEVPEEPPEPLQLILTADQIAGLPERMREEIPDVRKEYDGQMRAYRLEADAYLRLRKAIDERDGALALRVLLERRDYEYEYWSFEELEDAVEKL